jgi:hypothetical protein
MARPLAIEPDLPRRLIEGEAEAAREVSLRLPRPPRASLAELVWHREQLLRLAAGKAPKLTLSPRLALLRMLFEERGFADRRAAYLAGRAGAEHGRATRGGRVSRRGAWMESSN